MEFDDLQDAQAEVAKLTRERDTYYAQTLIDAGHEATIAELRADRAQFRAALKLVQGACQDELSTREIWAIAFQGLNGHAPEDSHFPPSELPELRADRERMDWLQEAIVDTIYLDDFRVIDVRGNNLRAAIDAARKAAA